MLSYGDLTLGTDVLDHLPVFDCKNIITRGILCVEEDQERVVMWRLNEAAAKFLGYQH